MHIALAVIGTYFFVKGLVSSGRYLSKKSEEESPVIESIRFVPWIMEAQLGLAIMMLSGVSHWSAPSIVVGNLGMFVLASSMYYFGWVTHRTRVIDPWPWAAMSKAVMAMAAGFGLCFAAFAV